MKRSFFKQLTLVSISAAIACTMVGCSSYYSEEMRMNHGTRTTHVDVERYGDERIVERDTFSESYRCVNHKGKRIHATCRQECLDKGGKVVHQIIEKERTTESRVR